MQQNIPATDAPTDLSRARLAIVVGNQIMSVPADGLSASFGFQPADAALTSFAGVSWVAGDILYFSGVDTAARLAKGTASQQLRMNAGATAPEWFTPAGLDAALSSIAGVSWVAGDLPYWSGVDTSARLAKGTAGQVLTMNAGATAPQWSTLSVDYGAGNAALGVGSVGTYALLGRSLTAGSGVYASPGTTKAGSELQYAMVRPTAVTVLNGSSPSGTWRAMGYMEAEAGVTRIAVTTWLRIS